jgi:hypothetical protein
MISYKAVKSPKVNGLALDACRYITISIVLSPRAQTPYPIVNAPKFKEVKPVFNSKPLIVPRQLQVLDFPSTYVVWVAAAGDERWRGPSCGFCHASDTHGFE